MGAALRIATIAPMRRSATTRRGGWSRRQKEANKMLNQKISYSATNWWLRSPNTNNTNNVWNVNSNGNYNNNDATNTYGIRPALMESKDK